MGTALENLAAANWTAIPEILGTLAFALSGIKFASKKNIDWFGAYIVGFVTAVGGGTLRDVFLGHIPFWMTDPRYTLTTAVAMLMAILFHKRLFRLGSTLFIFDTVGLGLFTIVGIGISLDAGLPLWISIMMGALTGTAGGVLRDVLLNEVPLLFKQDIYALASLAGGLVYMALLALALPQPLIDSVAAATVIAIRLLAVRFHIHLPILRDISED